MNFLSRPQLSTTCR